VAIGASVYAEPVPGRTVGRITIDAHDIFDPTLPEESGWIYRTANILHIQTNHTVIRRELLLKEGDPYDPDLVDESERNLRRYSFLRRVKITPTEQPDGTVDLNVHTKDTWTLEPQLDFSRVGNQSRVKMGVVERNLFGTGKRLGAFYERNADGSHNTVAYRDPQFLGRALELNTQYIDGENLKQYGASIAKPFRSTRTKTSFEVSNFFTEEEITAYDGGHEIGRFEKEGREVAFLAGRSLGSTSKKTKQGTLAFRQSSKDYDTISGNPGPFLKPPQDLSIVEAGAGWQALDFITERHIDRFDRDEDFNLGPGAGFTFGVGQDWKKGGTTELLPAFNGQVGHFFGPGHFSLFSTNYRSRVAHDKTDNLLLRLDFKYFNRIRQKSTLAGHIAYDHGYRLDPEDRMLLGEETGLRGYSNGQFSGDRRLLVNLEDRLYFAEDVWHLVSFGGAVFFDSGYAWGASHNFSLSDMRSSVGIGFRLAMSRSSRNEPIRFDLSYALNGNNESSRLIFSVQSGVKFGGLETVK
jgi:outer membrane protein assembly factor BamA